jgi:hypothetical protein
VFATELNGSRTYLTTAANINGDVVVNANNGAGYVAVLPNTLVRFVYHGRVTDNGGNAALENPGLVMGPNEHGGTTSAPVFTWTTVPLGSADDVEVALINDTTLAAYMDGSLVGVSHTCNTGAFMFYNPLTGYKTNKSYDDPLAIAEALSDESTWTIDIAASGTSADEIRDYWGNVCSLVFSGGQWGCDADGKASLALISDISLVVKDGSDAVSAGGVSYSDMFEVDSVLYYYENASHATLKANGGAGNYQHANYNPMDAQILCIKPKANFGAAGGSDTEGSRLTALSTGGSFTIEVTIAERGQGTATTIKLAGFTFQTTTSWELRDNLLVNLVKADGTSGSSRTGKLSNVSMATVARSENAGRIWDLFAETLPAFISVDWVPNDSDKLLTSTTMGATTAAEATAADIIGLPATTENNINVSSSDVTFGTNTGRIIVQPKWASTTAADAGIGFEDKGMWLRVFSYNDTADTAVTTTAAFSTKVGQLTSSLTTVGIRGFVGERKGNSEYTAYPGQANSFEGQDSALEAEIAKDYANSLRGSGNAPDYYANGAVVLSPWKVNNDIVLKARGSTKMHTQPVRVFKSTKTFGSQTAVVTDDLEIAVNEQVTSFTNGAAISISDAGYGDTTLGTSGEGGFYSTDFAANETPMHIVSGTGSAVDPFDLHPYWNFAGTQLSAQSHNFARGLYALVAMDHRGVLFAESMVLNKRGIVDTVTLTADTSRSVRDGLALTKLTVGGNVTVKGDGPTSYAFELQVLASGQWKTVRAGSDLTLDVVNEYLQPLLPERVAENVGRSMQYRLLLRDNLADDNSYCVSNTLTVTSYATITTTSALFGTKAVKASTNDGYESPIGSIWHLPNLAQTELVTVKIVAGSTATDHFGANGYPVARVLSYGGNAMFDRSLTAGPALGVDFKQNFATDVSLVAAGGVDENASDVAANATEITSLKAKDVILFGTGAQTLTTAKATLGVSALDTKTAQMSVNGTTTVFAGAVTTGGAVTLVADLEVTEHDIVLAKGGNANGSTADDGGIVMDGVSGATIKWKKAVGATPAHWETGCPLKVDGASTVSKVLVTDADGHLDSSEVDATKLADIATNTSSIATNTSSIATNTTNITAVTDLTAQMTQTGTGATGTTTFAGAVSGVSLTLDGVAVTSTAAEINSIGDIKSELAAAPALVANVGGAISANLQLDPTETVHTHITLSASAAVFVDVPTAASIIAHIADAAIGQTFRFKITNNGVSDVTLRAGAGSGVVLHTSTGADIVIGPTSANSKTYLAVLTNVTGGSEAYRVILLG